MFSVQAVQILHSSIPSKAHIWQAYDIIGKMQEL